MIRSVYAALALVFLAACEPPPAEEMLELEVQTVALVDVACNQTTGECQGDEVVDAVLVYKAGLTVFEVTAEFLQYEVSYEFGEGLPTPPVYGGPTQISVTSGTERRFSIRTAGLDQRLWAAANFPQTRLEGKGRLTLYGYDHKNDLVTIRAPFDAVFDDFLGGGDTVAQ